MVAKAVFFDLDGTLVDSNEFHILAWAEAIEMAGLRIARSALRNEIGKGADMLIPALFPGLGGLQRDLLEKTQGKVFKTRFLRQIRPFRDANALLSRLHATGSKIFLVSSASRREADHYAKLLGVQDLLSGIVSLDDAEQSKPAADLFELALRLVEPVGLKDVVLAVGDTPYDIEAAAKCRIATLAVRSGGFDDQSLQGALAIYTDVQELLKRLPDSPLAAEGR
jgi:phosphoglycolate phosphatase-like HAD superfamily hydrolase